VLLLGGRHKGESYAGLGDAIRKHCRSVIAYGEAGPLVVRDLADVTEVIEMGRDFTAVIERARSVARTGDAVLLAPACSSFDMFRNYGQRGDEFRRLAGGGGAE